jgi:sugar-specific transcriptional regulator TrmB
MQKDIFDGLSKLGLSSYEIKIYKTLLLKGQMTSTEVVKETNIPQPRIYDLFGSLEKKGFIEGSIGKKRLYKAVPISYIFERERKWLESYSFNLERYVQNMKMYSDNYLSFISLVEGVDHVSDKILSMIEQTQDEIILSVSYSRFKIIYPALVELQNRGVTLLILVFLEGDQKLHVKFKGNYFVRTMKAKPIEMVISDRKQCLIKVETKRNEDEIALYFEEDNLIHVMSYYFNYTVWQNANVYVDNVSNESIKLRTIWLACDIVEYYIAHGFNVNAHLKGYYLDDYRELDGEIFRVEKIPLVRNTFFMKIKGQEYSVGGKTSSIEHFRMLFLALRPEIISK